MNQSLEDILEGISEKDPRYKPEAYEFVLEALTFTQKKFKKSRHVTGKELLEGIKVLLMQEFGPMTMTVLNFWGVAGTEDFGNIVFNLVKERVLSKTEEDKIETFRNVFDFEAVFDKGYRQGVEKKISRMR